MIGKLFWNLRTLLSPFKELSLLEFHHPLAPPPSQVILSTSIDDYRDNPQPLLRVISLKSPKPGLTKTTLFHFRLLFTVIHEDIIKVVMPVIHGSDTPCDAVSRYSVLDRKIPELAIKLESVQEERENPFCII